MRPTTPCSPFPALPVRHAFAGTVAFALAVAGSYVAATPSSACELNLVVPIYDGQTWTGGCNVRINGVVWPEDGCPPVARIHWNWGDGSSGDQWFPAAHTYQTSGTYRVTVTPYDAVGGSTSQVLDMVLGTCDPMGPVDPTLYATDFQSFSYGNVNNQDGWQVGALSCPSCPYTDPGSPDGWIVDTGSGQKAAQVRAAPGWGDEVGRYYPPATRRFVAIALDFQTRDGGGPFWFMDNKQHGQTMLEALYFWPWWIRSDATPGIGGSPHLPDQWHRTGIEVDQQTSRIIGYFFDGAWKPDDDSQGSFGATSHSLFYFRGIGAGERLWVDNLSVSESDVPRSARFAARELGQVNWALPPAAFQNANLQRAFGQKISEILTLTRAGAFSDAAEKLQHDILAKTNGCADIGRPDRNDWIVDCASQQTLRPAVERLLRLLGHIE